MTRWLALDDRTVSPYVSYEQDYGYDTKLGYLSSAAYEKTDHSSTPVITTASDAWGYDAAGNRNSETHNSSTLTAFTPDASNRMGQSADWSGSAFGTSFSYTRDVRGNRTQRGSPTVQNLECALYRLDELTMGRDIYAVLAFAGIIRLSLIIPKNFLGLGVNGPKAYCFLISIVPVCALLSHDLWPGRTEHVIYVVVLTMMGLLIGYTARAPIDTDFRPFHRKVFNLSPISDSPKIDEPRRQVENGSTAPEDPGESAPSSEDRSR